MMVKSRRILAALSKEGFQLHGENIISNFDMYFWRPSYAPSLYEFLQVAGQGKSGEAIYAHAEISILRNTTFGESIFLSSIGEGFPTYSQTRKWTIIKNADDAIAWEREFTRIGPGLVHGLALTKGPDLLNRTRLD